MDWWQQPYPGGPMVPVPGFPRPLYPPGIAGHPPSSDGPDVIAYKRTVSRAGRWPWGVFDDSYSMAFALGKSGNVGETGVAGVQRQNGIQDTGQIGEATFNLLRSILIPAGLPHAGEYAMDANAQSLIAEAWRQFNSPPVPQTVRLASLARAEQFIGVTEYPYGSNEQQFGAWYGANGEPWCAIFVTYCFETNALRPSPSFLRGSRWAFVPYFVTAAVNGQYGLSITKNPQPGDAVAYDWTGGGYDHMGIFKGGDSFEWEAIEGNTSPASNSNGGEVMLRTRKIADAAAVTFIRIAEPA
jgi:hypothetical protein